MRLGKYVLIWEKWRPRFVKYINLAEWRRKSNFVDAACKAAELEDDGDERQIRRR